jgi:hypothetical protein
MKNEPSEHPDVRYERKDIRLSGLLWLIVAAICVLVVLSFGIWHFYWWQAGAEQAIKQSPYSLAPALSKQLPREPRLEQLNEMEQGEAASVFAKLAAQEKVLNSYGPTAEKGFVHIPIQQAIKVTAGKLPVKRQAQGDAAKDQGLIDAGESNSGRMFRGGS